MIRISTDSAVGCAIGWAPAKKMWFPQVGVLGSPWHQTAVVWVMYSIIAIDIDHEVSEFLIFESRLLVSSVAETLAKN